MYGHNPRVSDERTSDVSLDGEMAQVLARMQLLATGSITNYSPTGHGVPGSRPPMGVRLDGASPVPMHVYWHQKWGIAVDRDLEAEQREGTSITRARRETLKLATDVLDRSRKQHKIVQNTETREQLEGRIVEEADGWEIDQAVQVFNVTPTFIRQARLKAGRNAKTGKRPDEKPNELEDKRKHARELAENGMTERQIGMITGLSKTTVRRAIGKTA